jgi:xylulokinase
MALVLGMDIGSSAVKVAVLDPATGLKGSASAPVALHSARPGFAEADPDQWWSSTATAVRSALEQTGSAPGDVAAIATTGMVPAVLTLDRDGIPIGAAVLQNDARAHVEIEELGTELADVDVVKVTGSALTQQSVAPLARWLRRHEPERWARTRMLCGSYDWLAMRLGGEPHIERNWAIESGLFTLAGGPLEEVLSAAGIPQTMLPPVRDPGEQIGTLSAQAADALGLRAGTLLAVGGADHVASAYAAGLAQPADTLLKLGGAGDILSVSTQPLTDPRLYLDRHMIPGLWLPNGCMATSGSLLRWFRQLAGPEVEFATLDEEGRQAGPGAGGLMCLPYFLGEKSPIHDPDARGIFAGLHLGHERGHMYRACLEGVAHGFRHHLDILGEHGIRPGAARVTNGGAASTLWKQVVADVCQLVLEPVEGHPGASLGAAVAAALSAGELTDWDRMASFVRVARPIEPDPSAAPFYDEAHAIYRQLSEQVSETSHRLAALARH